jgi:hypothetical protein
MPVRPPPESCTLAGLVSLAAQTRRYFIGQTVIGAAIVNALINGAFGWLAMLKLPTLPLWGAPSVFIDTVLTAFGVAFGTVLVVTFQARKDMFAGKAMPQDPTGVLGRVIYSLPEGLLARGAWLGIACVVVFVPLPIFLLAALEMASLSADGFIAFKAGFSAVVGACVTPLISLYAMVSARGRSI